MRVKRPLRCLDQFAMRIDNHNYFDMRIANACRNGTGEFWRVTCRVGRRVASSTGLIGRACAGCALVIAWASGPFIADAQEFLNRPDLLGNPMNIQNRSRPDYDADGLELGSFLLFPSLTVGEVYDSNIFATETGEISDFITEYSPSISAVSDWNNHALAVRANANGGLYADNSDQDFFNYGFAAAGRLDVTRATNLTGGLTWDHLTEQRGSPNDAGGIDPTEYDEYGIVIGASTRPSRLSVGVEGSYTHLDFDNVAGPGGTTINNDDRDRHVMESLVRVGYEFRSDYEGFVQAGYADVDYDSAVDDSGVNRDNQGWRFDVGAAFNVTDTLAGDVFVGYLERTYDDPTFNDASGLDLGADVYWSITELTTAQLEVTRSFDEAIQTGASSILATSGLASVDHELRRNVIIGADVGLSNFDYEGIARNDDVWLFGVDGRYLINRYFFAGGGADYIMRDSNTPGLSFDQVVVGVFVGGQL